MGRDLFFTGDSAADLEDLYQRAVEDYRVPQAEQFLRQMAGVARNVTRYPEFSLVPPELRALGLSDYRQVVLKPYRVIYGVQDNRVIVYVVADWRRDLQSLLSRRMFAP